MKIKTKKKRPDCLVPSQRDDEKLQSYRVVLVKRSLRWNCSSNILQIGAYHAGNTVMVHSAIFYNAIRNGGIIFWLNLA